MATCSSCFAALRASCESLFAQTKPTSRRECPTKSVMAAGPHPHVSTSAPIGKGRKDRGGWKKTNKHKVEVSDKSEIVEALKAAGKEGGWSMPEMSFFFLYM